MALFSDEQLGLGIQQGHQDHLALLVERYHASLLGFLYHLTGRERGLADDLVQETFLRVIGRIGTYHYPRPLKPWLYAITVNLVRDHYKQADFRRTDSMPESLDLAVADTPETELIENEQEQEVLAALRSIPILQREVILLRYCQDLSLKEIAQVVQVPVGTVKSRLSLGLKQIKEKLKAIE
jgi:RNA polymerase sigma factor (sigma-70 family)